MKVLEFKNISFGYDTNYPVIDNMSFSIDKNKLVSIVGSSGCGKSTIFKLILSLLKQDSGEILYNNQNINSLKSYAGYMPQKDLLFPWKTIKDNLAIPLEIKKVPRLKREEKIKNILKDMNLSEYINKMPYELSGGMRQRVSFARTILTDSNLLLFDEPLSALDYITKIQMQQWLLDKLRAYDDKTAIFITHDVEEAIFLSDIIFVVSLSPITRLNEIKVDLPKNRTRDMLDTSEMIKLKNSILELISK